MPEPSLVTVAEFVCELEAHLCAHALEDHDIEVYIAPGAVRHGALGSMLDKHLVQVASVDAKRAAAVLQDIDTGALQAARTSNASNDASTDENHDDAPAISAPACPICAASQTVSARIWFVFAGWRCGACAYVWRARAEDEQEDEEASTQASQRYLS